MDQAEQNPFTAKPQGDVGTPGRTGGGKAPGRADVPTSTRGAVVREEMADIEATDADGYVVVEADGVVKAEADDKKSAAEASGLPGDSKAATDAAAGDALAAAVDKSMTLTDTAASGDALAPPPPSAPRPSNDNVGADMCVRSLAWETTDQALREYFERFGEVTTCTVKTGPDGRSRGFGFVNFADKSAIAAVLETQHVVDSRALEILPPRLTDLAHTTKVFVGRLEPSVPVDTIREHFAQFGEVLDVYMPHPHKGFCFVTYADNASALAALAHGEPVGEDGVGGAQGGSSLHAFAGTTVQVKPPTERRPQNNGHGGHGGRFGGFNGGWNGMGGGRGGRGGWRGGRGGGRGGMMDMGNMGNMGGMGNVGNMGGMGMGAPFNGGMPPLPSMPPPPGVGGDAARAFHHQQRMMPGMMPGFMQMNGMAPPVPMGAPPMHAAPRAPGAQGAGEYALYVSNIAWEAGWQDLKDHFKQFGRVVFVDIARDAQTGKSMGRGIVRFDDADSAARAVQFGNGSIFMGRDLNVREDRMMAQQGLHVQPPLPPMQPGGLPPQAVAAGAGDA